LQHVGVLAGFDEAALGLVMLSCRITTTVVPSIVVRALVGPLPVCSEKTWTTAVEMTAAI